MIRIATTLIVATLAALVAGVAPTAASETETFGVTPYPPRAEGTDRRSFAFPLEVGHSYEDAVRVYNRTDGPITLSIYTATATVDDNDVVAVGFDGSQRSGIADWISLDRGRLELGADEETIIPFRISITSETPGLGAIVVEAEPGSTGEGLDVVERIAVVVRAVDGPVAGAKQVQDEGISWRSIAAAITATIALLLVGMSLLARRRSARQNSLFGWVSDPRGDHQGPSGWGMESADEIPKPSHETSRVRR